MRALRDEFRTFLESLREPLPEIESLLVSV